MRIEVSEREDALMFARRLVRAADTKMKIEQEDAVFNVTDGNNNQVVMNDGNIKRCSCIDYRSRKVPCKHMLRVWLEFAWADLAEVEVTHG